MFQQDDKRVHILMSALQNHVKVCFCFLLGFVFVENVNKPFYSV